MRDPSLDVEMLRRHCEAALNLDAAQRSRYFEELNRSDPEMAQQVQRRVVHRLKLERQGCFEFLTANDPFIIESEIGRGANGTVYRARHRLLETTVALKILHSPLGADRFLVEARSAAHLDHPAIAKVFDCGVWNGRPYLALEFVDGQPLADCQADLRGNFPAIAELLRAVAEGVGYAHSQGIVHRDLKPTNIIVSPSGDPCIIDFGCAKSAHTQVELTSAGEIIGTPRYMSPEQATGDQKHIGPPTDIFALGIILYELLTGQHPFFAQLPKLFHQLTFQQPPRPRAIDKRIPLDLEAICLKCLEKVQLRRYSDGSELASELQRFLSNTPVKARPHYRTRYWVRKLTPIASRSVLLAAFVAIGIGPFALAGFPTLRYWWHTVYDNWLVSRDIFGFIRELRAQD